MNFPQHAQLEATLKDQASFWRTVTKSIVPAIALGSVIVFVAQAHLELWAGLVITIATVFLIALHGSALRRGIDLSQRLASVQEKCQSQSDFLARISREIRTEAGVSTLQPLDVHHAEFSLPTATDLIVWPQSASGLLLDRCRNIHSAHNDNGQQEPEHGPEGEASSATDTHEGSGP